MTIIFQQKEAKSFAPPDPGNRTCGLRQSPMTVELRFPYISIRRQGELFEKGGQYFYHAVATNWLEEEKNSEEVLKWHNQRGQAESFNKELKVGFGMERMPCGQSYANAVFFRIGVLAYNLFIGFKRLCCPESWMKQTIATFRWKMVQVAGRIVKHAGETVLKLMIDLEKLELFKGIRRKSFELSLCPDG